MQTSSGESAGASGVAAELRLDLGGYLKKSWDLLMANLGLFILATLILDLIIVASAVTCVGPLILMGPMTFGYLTIIKKRLDGEEASLGDLFSGFKRFAPALVVGLLTSLIVGASELFVIGPIFVGPMVFFAMPLALFAEVPATEAISRSFQFCFKHFGAMLLLNLVLGLICSAGAIACGVGILFTAPLAAGAAVVSYNEYYLKDPV